MNLKKRVQSWIRDDEKHAEITAREEHADAVAAGLREEREQNGFGRMFAVDAGLGSKHRKKGRLA